MITSSSAPCSIAKNITLITTNGNWLISAEAHKAVAKRVDSGATLFGVNKNGTGTKLHGDRPGSAYSLNKVIAETSGRRLAFVEG